ncbi:MAG TPA: GNAT family N-acetyltransferase, partial [Gemmatimonadales bacterium]|nr:GNAT family N-acetyltransferase [Gemmatimonadales bacterium]
MRERLTKTLVRFPWLVVEAQGRPIGYAYASRHRERPAYTWSAEVSIYVDQAAQRAGVGRQLYAALFAILELQGIQSALAGIILPNPQSLAFHTGMGFLEVAHYPNIGFKAGTWRETVWLQRAIGAYPSPPPPFRPLPELLGTPAFTAILALGADTPAT